MRRTVPLLLVLALAVPVAVAVDGRSAAAQESCPPLEDLTVPGAEYVQAVCLDDLTTLSNERTDRGGSTGAGSRESGSLHSSATEHPDSPVPGVQIEGWFPDSCDHHLFENNRFMPDCENGRRANSQFVIRIPNDWDGETLLVAGTPGIRTQFSSDIIISDRVLHRGWAYASQDKGNTGVTFYRAGDTETGDSPDRWIPGKAIEQWADLMAKTAVAARGALEHLHGTEPGLTYAAGISNGGYQTRLALERYPELYDAGIDWEGTLFRAEGPNLFTYLPPILRNYHAARAGSQDAYWAMVHEGRLPPWSQPIWDHHYAIYWGLTQRIYRQVFDPEYTGYAPLVNPVLTPGDPDAQYDYFARPDEVHDRVGAVSNSGDTHGLPLITIHGDLDALLPISTDSDVYADLVRAHGHGDSFRYWVVEGGTHVDTLADSHPDVMRPLFPCFLEALDAVDAWARAGAEPPPNGFIPFPPDTTHEERANACSPPAPLERVAGPGRVETSLAAARRGFGITETVVIATAGDFPDALTAAPLAAELDAPILLVGDALTDGHRVELERMGTVAAVVVGGPAAVPASVDAELTELGLSVRRVAGADRYGTAAEIAREVDAEDGVAFVATGDRFPDALSGAPVAAALGAPILLTPGGALPPATREALSDLSVERTWVLGGPAAVADAVVGELPAPRRIAGADRYATSVAVADLALTRGLQAEHLHVATGRAFPDALAAGPLAFTGQRGAPGRGIVLLVDGQQTQASGSSWAWLQRHADAIRQTLVLGGPSAVSTDVEARLRSTLP